MARRLPDDRIPCPDPVWPDSRDPTPTPCRSLNRSQECHGFTYTTLAILVGAGYRCCLDLDYPDPEDGDDD